MGKKRACPLFRIFIIAVCFTLIAGSSCLTPPAYAWFWGEQPLVTVNGIEFTANDFKVWWQNWKDKGDKLPGTPDQFVDWQLMAQEALAMQFDQEPSYLRKLQVFLQVRSLMIFKGEEIDSKNRISDKDAWRLYEQEYCPSFRLNALIFIDQKNAEEKMHALKADEISFVDLVGKVGTDSGPKGHDEKVVRLKKLDEMWRNSLKNAKAGDLIGPLKTKDLFVVVQLSEVLGPRQDDFAQVKKGIVTKLKKKNARKLTGELIDRLMKKYEVKIDEEMLVAIKADRLSEEDAKKILISTNKDQIAVGDFVKKLQKSKAFREKYKFEEQEFEKQKKWVLANILSQTLISWEAIASHYEEKEPFKGTFDFYRRHRLVREVDRLLLKPESKITAEDVRLYYDENDAILTSPEMVSILMLKGEPELIGKIVAEINQGSSFAEVVEKTFPGEIPVRHVSVEDLDKDLRKIVESLRVGEISKSFQHQGMVALVRLVGRKKSKKAPFKHVSQQIRAKMEKDKYAQAKKTLLDTLKKRSEIVINYKEWERVHKELEESYATKKNN